MRISFLGAGAIGSMFGGLLKRDAPELDVLLVTRGEHGRAVRERRSIELVGPWGAEVQSIAGSQDAADIAGSDIVVLTVKSQDTRSAMQSALPYLGDAIVASIQNGINDQALLEFVPAARLVMGMTATNMNALAPGRVNMQLDGPTIFGPPGREPLGSAVEQVIDVFQRINCPGISFLANENVLGIRYNKLTINVLGSASSMSASNFITDALCDGTWRAAVGWPLIRECRRVFDAAGVRLEPIPGRSNIMRIEKLLRQLDTPLLGPIVRFGARQFYGNRPVLFSLLKDIERGKPTEVEYINGEIVRLAKSCGTTAPVNELVVRMVHELEARGDGTFFTRDEVVSRMTPLQTL
jgi:2-dehydropantoate 2-reductase